jgi:hypothetical protein
MKGPCLGGWALQRSAFGVIILLIEGTLPHKRSTDIALILKN